MYLSNYTTNLPIEQVDQMEESEINYGYTRKRNYDEVVTIGFCPCNKRITNLDEAYTTKLDLYCSEKCSIFYEVEDNE